MNQSGFNSRAALCRELARREPASRTFWTAKAKHWSRLSKEQLHGEDGIKTDSGLLARWRVQSTKFLLILT